MSVTLAGITGHSTTTVTLAGITGTPVVPANAVHLNRKGTGPVSLYRKGTGRVYLCKAPGLTRNKYTWPFSVGSVWNTPIGSAATYSALNLETAAFYGTSVSHLEIAPTAPLRNLFLRSFYYDAARGYLTEGAASGVTVRWPDDVLIPIPPAGSTPDRPSGALQADGTYREFQYTVRPSSGSDISIYQGVRAGYDLTGDGITPVVGSFGGHGGSGLPAIGGCLRTGELTGQSPIRHALSFTMNLSRWGSKQGAGLTDGYRWPAMWADAAWSTEYGRVASGAHVRPGLGMGCLLAIPTSVSLAGLGLETAPAGKLAWTLQNYGAYIVDNTGELDSSTSSGWYMPHQINVDAGVAAEYPQVDTYTTSPTNPTLTAFGRDMNKIFVNLAIVTNNGPANIGGGGTPLQVTAPPFA